MSDGVIPTGRRARANRYRQDDETFGDSGHFSHSAQPGGGTRYEHGQVYGWQAPSSAQGEWNAHGGWDAHAASAQGTDDNGYGDNGYGDNWNSGTCYDGASWNNAADADWNNETADWNDGGARDDWHADADGSWNGNAANWNRDSGSAWDGDAANGDAGDWGGPAAEWSGDSWNSGDDAWESPADPNPSDEHRPVYTFRTASGEPLEFSRDGARVDSTASGAPESAAPASRSATRAARNRRSGGAHRVPAPPAALKGRAAVVAVAAGAVVAAGQTGMDTAPTTGEFQAADQVTELAAQSVSLTGAETQDSGAPQVLNVSTPMDLGSFDDILRKGEQFAADLAAQEAAKLRPLFTKFTSGNFTSGFGARWGVQHLGIDVAAPIGTPIYAVADGVVLEAGPASGFGMWVRLLHDDGTVTVYGHIDTATVSQGQYVMAGDQIATVGNRGFSTGPHCHFEVWLNGVNKIDPVPWLASRGIALGPQRD
ncbi:peptidoglycan DD-metalloendopeptidase family protein [Nocardia otitidiscaviarum]|nr:peptidoglycan DD-metalloendopeptidase family protein [Nocardia otitidiscaviarum]